jgi:hypothetical protein
LTVVTVYLMYPQTVFDIDEIKERRFRVKD